MTSFQYVIANDRFVCLCKKSFFFLRFFYSLRNLALIVPRAICNTLYERQCNIYYIGYIVFARSRYLAWIRTARREWGGDFFFLYPYLADLVCVYILMVRKSTRKYILSVPRSRSKLYIMGITTDNNIHTYIYILYNAYK